MKKISFFFSFKVSIFFRRCIVVHIKVRICNLRSNVDNERPDVDSVLMFIFRATELDSSIDISIEKIKDDSIRV